MFRSLVALLFTLFLTSLAYAQASAWHIDSNHSSAQFSVRHLGVSTVRGAFTKVSGTAQYDASDATKDSLEATIEASSVDTRVEMRDKDIRSPHFLDVEKYPSITFKSKQAKSAGAGRLQIMGDLTIHGVTKEVVLDVDGPNGPIQDPMGNQRIGASASTKINRQDFEVTGAPGVVGDEINITIDAELIQPGKKQ